MPDPTPPTVSPREATGRVALSPLITVLLTLIVRPWFWSWPLGTALLAAFVTSRMPAMYDPGTSSLRHSSSPPYDGLFFSAFMFACAVGFCAAAVTGHFVQLLNPPRGHVVPGLRRNALAAMILLTVLVVVGPAWVWPHPTVNGIGGPVPVRAHAFAIAAVLAAQLAWTQFAPVTGVMVVFACAALALPGAQGAILRMLAGQSPALERGLLAVAAALFAGLWTAIGRRRDRTSQTACFAEAALRGLQRLYPSAAAPPPPVAGTIPALAPAPLTPRARRRLLRHVAAAGNPAPFVGLVVGVALVLWVLICHFIGAAQPDAMTPRVLCFMVGIVPALFATANGMENRGPLITHGLLLPASRAQYVRAIGLAMLTNLCTLWICALVPVFAILVLLLPAGLRPTPRALAPLLIVAAAYQLFAFGLIAWLLRLRHRIAITAAFSGFGGLGVVVLIDFGLARTVGPATGSAILASVLAAGGVALTLTAYHRWANSEPPSAGPSKTAARL